MDTDPTQPLGRRERNKQRVKEHLYTVALSLFSERGFDKTSVDEIAARADVARGTFFNYFQRKEDLIGLWSERRRNRLEAAVQKDEEGLGEYGQATLARLRRSMTLLAQINEEEHEATIPMITAWVKAGLPLQEEPYTAEIFAKIILEGRERGELALDVDPQHVGYMLRDLYLGALYRWCQRQSSLGASVEALTADLQASLTTLVNGIVSHPPATDD